MLTAYVDDNTVVIEETVPRVELRRRYALTLGSALLFAENVRAAAAIVTARVEEARNAKARARSPRTSGRPCRGTT